MSILPKLASSQERRDEEPNKELGRKLVKENDTAGIQEAADNLHHEDKRIQSDCLSVLEQVGHLNPALIENYAADFLKLITSKENRLVWAAMINLALIADRKPKEIFDNFEKIVRVMETGSVITIDNGIKVLARIAAASAEYNREIMPFLFEQLRTCRSKSVPQYSESIAVAVNPNNQAQFIEILHYRMDHLSDSQRRRVQKILNSN